MTPLDFICIIALLLIVIIHLALNLREDDKLIKAYDVLVDMQNTLITKLIEARSEEQPATPTVENPGENG